MIQEKYLLSKGFTKEDGGFFKLINQYEGSKDYIFLVPEMGRLVVEYRGNIIQLCDCDSAIRMRYALSLVGYSLK